MENSTLPSALALTVRDTPDFRFAIVSVEPARNLSRMARVGYSLRNSRMSNKWPESAFVVETIRKPDPLAMSGSSRSDM